MGMKVVEIDGVGVHSIDRGNCHLHRLSNGDLYVIALQPGVIRTIKAHKSTDNGSTCSLAVSHSLATSLDQAVSSTLRSDDDIEIVYIDYGTASGTYGLNHGTYDTSADSFSSFTNPISNAGTVAPTVTARRSAVCVDFANNIHCAYVDTITTRGVTRHKSLYARHDEGLGTWGGKKNLANERAVCDIVVPESDAVSSRPVVSMKEHDFLNASPPARANVLVAQGATNNPNSFVTTTFNNAGNGVGDLNFHDLRESADGLLYLSTNPTSSGLDVFTHLVSDLWSVWTTRVVDGSTLDFPNGCMSGRTRGKVVSNIILLPIESDNVHKYNDFHQRFTWANFDTGSDFEFIKARYESRFRFGHTSALEAVAVDTSGKLNYIQISLQQPAGFL